MGVYVVTKDMDLFFSQVPPTFYICDTTPNCS